MSMWLIISKKLQEGVKLINSISTTKFALLLKQIVQSADGEVFTKEQLSKLEESLHMSKMHLELLLQSLLYIYKQSSKIMLKPTALHKQLVEELGVEKEKADEFVKIWTCETKEQFGDFENRRKLTSIAWELNLQNPCEPVQKVRLQLSLSNFHDKADNIIVEMNEEQLMEMYSTLENVQGKLDKRQS